MHSYLLLQDNIQWRCRPLLIGMRQWLECCLGPGIALVGVGGVGITGPFFAHDAYPLCEFILSPGVLLVSYFFTCALLMLTS